MLRRKTIETDLVVVGGGMAGIITALSAAREGVKVVLMQERPVLGGNASSEIRMWICGAQGENMRETGILEEIMLKTYHYNPTKNPYIFDSILLDTVRREKNITLLLNCTCMDASTENGVFPHGRTKKIKSVSGYQMTTQTFYDISAKFFADCSGDSILAPLTGAEFRVGRESADDFGEATHVEKADKMTMGNSCLFQIRETEAKVPHVELEWATKLKKEDFRRLPEIHNPCENYWFLELGGNKNTIDDSEEIAQELQGLALGAYEHIKTTDDYNAQNFDLDFLAFLPGKRESRRYIGEYTIKQQDITQDVIFDDTVAFGGWPIDDHFPGGFYHHGRGNTDIKTSAPYCIPYRILYSKNVDNLFFAGRNISATHFALSSLRVMATCSVMGQAVGTAVSIALKNNLSPHGVYLEKLSELQGLLMDNDCFLPHFKRNISNTCLDTPVMNGNDTLKNGEDRKNIIYGNEECGVAIDNGNDLSYNFKNSQKVNAVHIVFDSDLDRTTISGTYCERRYISRGGNYLIGCAKNYLPKTLCKSFTLSVTDENGVTEEFSVDKNMLRSYHYKLNKAVKSIKLTPKSNWGGSDRTTVVSFDFN